MGQFKANKLNPLLSVEKNGTVLYTNMTEELNDVDFGFRALAENSSDLVTRFDRQKNCLYANPAAMRFFGLSEDELTSMSYIKTQLNSEMMIITESKCEKALVTGKPETTEFHYILPPGKVYYFDTKIIPEFLNGEINTFLIISRDITALKDSETMLNNALGNLERLVKERTDELEKAYNLLKESEKGLAEAQKMAHIGNWQWNLITNEFYCSDELYRIFRLNPQEIDAPYKEVFNYIHPEDREYVANSIMEALNGKRYDAIDFRIILDDGIESALHTQGEVIFDEKNTPVRMRGTVQDITESKKAEQRLRESEEKYRNIVEIANEGISITDSKFKITYANKRMADMLGYTLEEGIGRSIWDFLSEESKAILKSNLERRVLGIDGGYELKFIRKDGSPIWTHMNSKPLLDEEGKYLGSVSMFTDITKRKEAEEKLRKSEQKYRNIIETTNEGILVIDNEVKITFVNKKLTEMLGYRQEELIGRFLYDFADKEGKAIIKQNIKKRRHGIDEVHEFRFLHKDSSSFWVLVSSKALFDMDGKFAGSLSMLTDITVRKEAEEKIRRLAHIVESSNDAIITISFEGIVASWNKGAEQIYGFMAEEVLGKHIMIIEPDSLKGEIMQLAGEIKQGKNVNHYETSRLKKDGTTINVSVTLSPITDQYGRLVAISCIGGDITEKRMAEQLLQEKKIAEVANRAKSDFLAKISHELRTPLNSIIGFSDMLLEQAYGDLNEKQQRATINISKSGKHLLNLINNLLDISKVESGKMELNYRNFELANKLYLIRNLLFPIANRKNIQIEIEIDSGLTSINADENKFVQIMYNLVDNAIKFSFENSQVKVTARKKGDLVEITVLDTGIGIKDEDRCKLFKPFSQIDTLSHRKYQGTGLGLSLVKQIVLLHGGYVWFRSTPSKGSVFAFAIPIDNSNGNLS